MLLDHVHFLLDLYRFMGSSVLLLMQVSRLIPISKGVDFTFTIMPISSSFTVVSSRFDVFPISTMSLTVWGFQLRVIVSLVDRASRICDDFNTD